MDNSVHLNVSHCDLRGVGTSTRGEGDLVLNKSSVVVAPTPPDILFSSDSNGWQRFLAAYRSGQWELCGNKDSSFCKDDENTSDLTKVYDVDGTEVQSKEFVRSHRYFAPPDLPLFEKRKRREALLRHDIILPHVRPYLQGYVEMAKRVFQCDLVTVSFASADDQNIIFLAADGPSIGKVPKCASICSHALLLQRENEIFLVNDMVEDWRFKRLFGKEGIHKDLSYRFHASAPIYLSGSDTPCCKIKSSQVHAGRFGIFSSQPRTSFSQEDCKMLLQFARFAQEAIENDRSNNYIIKSKRLQIDFARIREDMNRMLENRLSITSDPEPLGVKSNTSNTEGLLSINEERKTLLSILEDEKDMQNLSESIRKSLSATTVCFLNSPYMLATHNKRESYNVNLVSYSGDPTLLPKLNSDIRNKILSKWLEKCRKNDTKHTHTLTRGNLIQTSSISLKVNDKQVQCPYGVHHKQETLPCCCIIETRDILSAVDPLFPDKVGTYMVTPILADTKESEQIITRGLICVMWNTSMPATVLEMELCDTIAIHLSDLTNQEHAFKLAKSQMEIMRIMQHELRTPLNGIIGVSEAIREEFLSNSTADDKSNRRKWIISSESHSNHSNPARSERKNGRANAAALLAPQLESIYVSSLMLKKLFDNILSLDERSEERNEEIEKTARKSKKIEKELTFNLKKLIENVCLEEMQYFDLRAMRTFRATGKGFLFTPTPTATEMVNVECRTHLLSPQNRSKVKEENHLLVLPPPLILEFDKAIKSNSIGYPSRLKKILGNLISNSLRFTEQSGMVNVKVTLSSFEEMLQYTDVSNENKSEQSRFLVRGHHDDMKVSSETHYIKVQLNDTGEGMNEDFLREKYLFPFEKGNEFSQGVGLGSTVALGLLKSIGGAFTVSSKPGLGTTLQIFIPVREGRMDHKSDDDDDLEEEDIHSKGQITDFRTASLIGFEEELGTKFLSDKIEYFLKKMQIKLESKSKSDDRIITSKKHLYIIHENAFFAPVLALPTPSDRSKEDYFILFRRNALQLRPDPESFDILRMSNFQAFSPPFGPSTWSSLEKLLKISLSTESDVLSEKDNHPLLSPESQSSLNSSITKSDLVDMDSQKRIFEQEDYFSNQIDKEKCFSPSSPRFTPETEISFTPALVGNLSSEEMNFFRVLVVEDNPINMRLMTGVLRRLDCKYAEARDGLEAVEIFKSFRPTVVLLDIAMPKMDGFGACVAMRKLPYTIRPRIIAITAFSTAEDKTRGLDICGMDEWHIKPVTLSMLKSIILRLQEELGQETTAKM